MKHKLFCMDNRCACALTIALLMLWACPARTQQPKSKPKTTEERLNELSIQLEEAKRSAADSAAAVKALQEEQRRLREMIKPDTNRQRILENRVDWTQRRLDETVGYANGFYLKTEHDFLLKVNGLLQVGYEGLIWSGHQLPPGPALGQNQSTLLLRRAALALSGHVFFPELTYRVELNFGSQDPRPLLEAWFDVTPPASCCCFLRALNRVVVLRGGQQKIPVGREMLMPSSGLEFLERSGPTLAFAPGWDLGAVLHGEIPIKGGLSYQVGMFNGGGANRDKNDNVDLLYAVRLIAEPLGPLRDFDDDPFLYRLRGPFRFALGASFAYNLAPTDLPLRKGVTDAAAAAALSDVDADGKIDNVAVYTVGGELAARYGGLSLQSEFFYRREIPGRLGGDETLFGSAWGTYAQLGYFAPYPLRGLHIATRYSYWEPTHYGESRTTFVAGRVHEIGAVINLHTFTREKLQRLRWQLEYDHQWQRGLHTATQALGYGAQANVVRAQVQVAF